MYSRVVRFEAVPTGRISRLASALSVVTICVAGAYGHGDHGAADPADPLQRVLPPLYIVPLGTEISTLYDGREKEIEWEEQWRFICGSDHTGLTSDVLREIAESHYQIMESSPVVVVDNPVRGAGINIVFNLGSGVPPEAVPGFAMAEAYLESLFGDPITVNVNVSFANLGSGVLGATSISYTGNITYTTSRNGLINDMDSDDVIQSWLPTGSTLPVRYTSSMDVTNVSSIRWPRANYRAVIGSSSGSAGSMQFNTQFNWDWDPSNGVPGNRMSFVDVVIHETGHAMGFVSSVDFGGNPTPLDMFRFQRTANNPSTYAQFQTFARLLAFNSPNDDHNSDIIAAEYRMSDGSPYQASHFREQSSNIGLMDPALASGETHYPNFFSNADIAMFDAFGYDYPPCVAATITQQPQPADVCEGQTIVLSVSATGPSLTYQWRRGTTNLVNGGRISGATSATLTITNAQPEDAGTDYNCVVSSAGCPTTTNNTAVTVAGDAEFLIQPADANVPEGAAVQFNVLPQGFTNYTYQWRHNGSPLSDNARISGATDLTLTIDPVEVGDEGDYDCVVTSIAAGCQTPSATAVLTVTAACATPTITQQPSNQSACESQTVQLSVAATGDALTYQWRRGTSLIVDDGRISGATTPTLTITDTVPGDTGTNYNCLVTSGGSCSIASTNASVTITSYPLITQQPVSADVCEEGTIMLSVTASGTSLTYQWRRGTTDLVDNGRISGANSATLVIEDAEPGDIGTDYNCVVTASGSCSTISDDAAVSVEGPANILSQPSDLTVDEGDPAVFSISVQNPGAYTYEWRRDGVPLSNGGTISGADTPTLTISAAAAADEGAYNCVVTSALGCVTASASGVLTVNAAPDDCPEDLDGDGVVGLSDLSILLTNFGLPGGPADGDITGDGVIDLADLSALLTAFGTTCP